MLVITVGENSSWKQPEVFDTETGLSYCLNVTNKPDEAYGDPVILHVSSAHNQTMDGSSLMYTNQNAISFWNQLEGLGKDDVTQREFVKRWGNEAQLTLSLTQKHEAERQGQF